MLATPSPITASSAATADLQEDVLGAWAPDPAGWADLVAYEEHARPSASYVAQRLDVPRPNGSTSGVRVLHPAWHVALHHAVAALRDDIDAALSPGVFGYRRGADQGHRYADDWRAFCAYVTEAADSYPHFVLSDVRAFFQETPWATVIRCLPEETSRAAASRLKRVCAGLDQGDVTRLPTGYSDARLLGNAVLAAADNNLPVPFARWVDDYRLFATSAHQADAALHALDQGLERLGLRRGAEKTRILPSHDAVERHHATLASVYHPERDNPAVVAQRLHEVFERACADPVARRRDLRFSLPRLAEQHDDVAVPFALGALDALPWEAPRLARYLSAFISRPEVGRAIDDALVRALNRGDAWLVCRLAPLAAERRAGKEVAQALVRNHDRFVGTPAWGLIVRVLALRGCAAPIRRSLAGPVADARAVIAAARDLEISIPRWLARAEPALAAALAESPAPVPSAETLL